MKGKGTLVYDRKSDRMDICFGQGDYYGGLHCGTPLEVQIGESWIPTRIEMGNNWYLVGVKTSRLDGLVVRV